MKRYLGIIVGVVAGIAMGLIGGPVWIILPWGAIAIGLAYDSTNHKVLSSGAFGFVASFVFMMHGYNGNDSLLSRVPPFLIIAVFGGICGLGCGWIGRRFSQSKL